MKTCPVCEANIVGRTDKKFCSADCRAHYHNQKNRKKNRHIRRIDKILKRNRQILVDLEKQGLSYISIVFLEGMGFDSDYCTRKRSLEDHIEVSCYDKSYNIVREAAGIYVKINKNKSGDNVNGSNFH